VRDQKFAARAGVILSVVLRWLVFGGVGASRSADGLANSRLRNRLHVDQDEDLIKPVAVSAHGRPVTGVVTRAFDLEPAVAPTFG